MVLLWLKNSKDIKKYWFWNFTSVMITDSFMTNNQKQPYEITERYYTILTFYTKKNWPLTNSCVEFTIDKS